MNSLTVIQASQGLAKFLKATNEKRAIQNGIVIGADARHNSHRFAVLVANAMLALGFKVQWLGSVIHTPLVSWATGHTGAAAGVMITASHVRSQIPLGSSSILIYFCLESSQGQWLQSVSNLKSSTCRDHLLIQTY